MQQIEARLAVASANLSWFHLGDGDGGWDVLELDKGVREVNIDPQTSVYKDVGWGLWTMTGVEDNA